MSYVEDHFYAELRRGPMPRNAESSCRAKQRIHAALRKALHGLARPYVSWIRLRQKIFPTIFWDNFFFVEKFGSTGHRDPKQKPSEPHQARLPNCVFFQRWMPSHEKLVRPSAPDRSFGKGQAASNSIPQRPNGLCTCSWLPCVTV